MSQQENRAPARGPQGRSLAELASSMRETLGRGDLAIEGHRKAALRRLLHEHAAGLPRAEIEELVADLRSCFPDRIFESTRSARDLAARLATLEEEVGRLREERDRLRRQVDHLESLMNGLAHAIDAAASRSPDAADGHTGSRVLTAEAQEALVNVAGLLFSFALDQEETARSVEATLGRDSARSSAGSLAVLFPRLSGGKPLSPADLETIGGRLRTLRLLPGALMAGVQQSWKGGTREILEHLDSRTVQRGMPGVLKLPAVIKEVNQRFEQFWSQFDRNVEHYYRGRFERVYRDKMEEGP